MKIYKEDPFVSYFLFGTILLRFFLAGYLGLSDDEAYYWDWSNHLSLSYFDHPGMTSWLIGLSRTLFGETVFSVRVPALLCSLGTSLILWQLSFEMFGIKAARAVMILYLLTPIFSLGSMMMVPDLPMGLFWSLFLLYFWRGYRSSHFEWVILGLLMGLGILSKYTMIFVGFSAILFLLLKARSALFSKGFLSAFFIIFLLTLPIIIWNIDHGWPSFYFQFYQRHSTGGFRYVEWLKYWASQMVFVTPVLYFVFILVLYDSFKKIKDDDKYIWVLCFSLPVLIIFSLQALISEFKPHWPAPGYLALMIGCGAFWKNLKNQKYLLKRINKNILLLFIFLFLLPINLFFYLETIYPFAPKIYRFINNEKVWNPKWDPTNDLYGWDQVAKKIKEIRIDLGDEFFLAAHRYQLVAPLSFYMKERVWSFSELTDHYDFVQTKDDFLKLKGKSALFISDNRYPLRPHILNNYFNSCTNLEKLEILRFNERARIFDFWKCDLLK